MRSQTRAVHKRALSSTAQRHTQSPMAQRHTLTSSALRRLQTPMALRHTQTHISRKQSPSRVALRRMQPQKARRRALTANEKLSTPRGIKRALDDTQTNVRIHARKARSETMTLRKHEKRMFELLSALRDAQTRTPELRQRERMLYFPLSEINRRTGIPITALKKWCRNYLDEIDTLQKISCDVRGTRKTIYASIDDALECAERARARTSAGRKMK
jgi:hypothetical protein